MYLPILEASLRKAESSKNSSIVVPQVSDLSSLQTRRSPDLLSMRDSLSIKDSVFIEVDSKMGELDFAKKIILAITELEKARELPESARVLRYKLQENIADGRAPFCVWPAIAGGFAFLAGLAIVEVVYLVAVVLIVVVLVAMAIEAYSDPIGDALRAQLDELYAEIANLEAAIQRLQNEGTPWQRK